ncbi:unnamed protein product [Diatraea saccharalis]|uniref:Uncharacterized protein n=1 Tax=Diatraea saccharalis TaxID=40085 RepID=A0A9N9RAM6_9NEOP|nr:unnamed protein product [Diatraea saccharalis]
MADDCQSIIINIPKLRVCLKTSKELLKTSTVPSILKRINQKRLKKSSKTLSQKYFSMEHKPTPVNSLRRGEILLSYIMYTKKQKQINKKYKLRIPINEKYKTVQTNLQQRLFIEDPPNEVYTAIDIDEKFFNYVSGRHLKTRIPIFKSLKTAIADILRIKAEIGYRNDAILNIDINHRNEMIMYEESVKKCMRQAKYFDSFIYEDYIKSKSFLDKWDKLKNLLQLKEAELQSFASEQFTIISRLMGLDYLYRVQQKYGRFLYYLSPPTWRSQNREFARSVEIEAKGFDLGNSNEDETFKVIFEQMQNQSLNPVHPVLYFSELHDLMDIFDGIEKHLLHHFDYLTHLTPQRNIHREGIKYLKNSITQESTFVSNTVRRFEKYLEFENERCEQMKQKFFSIINGLFYNSVGAPDVLRLFVHLEFCYERVHSERPMNMDIISMAKSLEGMYMDYCYRLDYVHNDAVKSAVTKALNEEHQKLKTAKNASRELRLFNRLEKRLQKSHEVIIDKFCRPIIPPISLKIRPNKIEHQKPESIVVKVEKPLTDSELEYLKLFTDWVEGENPDMYLHRNDEDEDSKLL